jgi:hypothetical protein
MPLQPLIWTGLIRLTDYLNYLYNLDGKIQKSIGEISALLFLHLISNLHFAI